MESSRARHVVVVGGGITGLAAAYHLSVLGGPGLRVTVLEAAPEIGGKLTVSDVAGLPVDAGAESMLTRRPEALALTRAVGLGASIVHPATTGASVWSRGGLRPLPGGQLMGIPGDLRAVAASGVLSLPGLLRIPLDQLLPRTRVAGDVSIGGFVRARLGREVVDRLVEPLLGGVYAGHADEISLDAALPQLSAAVRGERSLLRSVREALPRPGAGPAGPVFGSVRGGLGLLPAAVAKASGAQIRTGEPVRELRQTPDGWQLVVGSTRSRRTLEADAVVLAIPAAPAARLLADLVPAAAAEVSGIEYASVAVITVALPSSAATPAMTGTGFLVPPVEGRLIKAATYSSAKWGWLATAAPELMVLRASIGRFREERDLQRDDADLVAGALADLADATGVAGPLLDSRVTRWGGSLPQYAVGHLDRVDRIRRAVATLPGLAVCGAAYDGVGIPACVASGHEAATQVLRTAAVTGQWSHG